MPSASSCSYVFYMSNRRYSLPENRRCCRRALYSAQSLRSTQTLSKVECCIKRVYSAYCRPLSHTASDEIAGRSVGVVITAWSHPRSPDTGLRRTVSRRTSLGSLGRRNSFVEFVSNPVGEVLRGLWSIRRPEVECFGLREECHYPIERASAIESHG